MTAPADPSASRGPEAVQEWPTLDDLLSRNARRTPEAVALLDLVRLPVGASRLLTYRKAERAVSRVAARLRGLGLARGAVVAVQAANTIESVVGLLGILRAGLVAAPIPLLWRHAEAAAALAAVEARALIAAAPHAVPDAEGVALGIAAKTFSIRHVCGFGETVADGLVPLGDPFGNAPAEPAALECAHNAAAPAVITFETGPEGHVPCPRSHAALMVGGTAVVLEAGLKRRASLVGTMLPSSFAVLATTLMPWLLTGGRLALHQPLEVETFAALLAEARADAAVLPGPLAAPLAEAGVIGGTHTAAIIGLWRSPERQPASPLWRGRSALIDVLAFGEAGLVALRRPPDGRPAVLKAGPIVAPAGAADGIVVGTLARTAAGTLAFGGPMTPQRCGAGEADAPAALSTDTGFPCRIDAATGALTLSGPPAGVVTVGGYRFALGELHDVVGAIAPDSVLTALPDLLAGQKLAGAGPDLDAIRRALAARGVSPLVGAAFRTRRAG
ncbi:MAG: acyl--CoA ligase [Variibacter sp.]|nr:acyl--CoA ligase [Variibacter sp.]